MVTTNYPYIIPEGVVWSARTGRLMTVAEAAAELEAQAGGGGGPPPGPGPLLSSAVATGPFTVAATFNSWQTLVLPAGTFDVWAVIYASMSANANGNLAVSLNGTAALAATSVMVMATTGGVMTGVTIPTEITLATGQTIHAGGNFFAGAGATSISAAQLFARQLA